MAKTKEQKEEILKKLVDNFGKAKSAVFVNFDGLNVADIQEFRSLCRENGLDYFVAKKTLLKLALDKNKLSEVDLTPYEKGVGTIFGYEDEVAPAQVADKFAKDHEALTLLGGVMMENPEGQKNVDSEGVKALAQLPSKDVLLGKVVGSINAPVSGFVNVLAGNIRNLVNVLNAVKDTKTA